MGKLGELIGSSLGGDKMTNPRFKEISQTLSEIDTLTSNKSIWGRTEYIRKHLNLLEEEYYQSSAPTAKIPSAVHESNETRNYGDTK